jgi:hypothetical protein
MLVAAVAASTRTLHSGIFPFPFITDRSPAPWRSEANHRFHPPIGAALRSPATPADRGGLPRCSTL